MHLTLKKKKKKKEKNSSTVNMSENKVKARC